MGSQSQLPKDVAGATSNGFKLDLTQIIESAWAWHSKHPEGYSGD